MSTQARPSIVFAHGLWADGSCFSKLIPALQADGQEVMASQHGLDSLASDVAAVKACLTRVSSPAILVGHSYGGTLITHAGTDPRVAGLVYIAALAPDADETSQSLQAKFPTTDVFSYIEIADGRIWLKPDGVVCFAGDLPEQEQKLVWATQGVPPRICSTRRSTARLGARSRAGSSWLPRTGPSTPSWNASWRSAWGPQWSRPPAATFRCSLTPHSYSMSSARPQTPFKRLRSPVRLARRSLKPVNSGISGADWWLCQASLCSPFSNFRFGVPETGSICDGDRFAELIRRICAAF